MHKIPLSYKSFGAWYL